MPKQLKNGKWTANLRLSAEPATEHDTEAEATAEGQRTAARIREIATALGCKAANRANLARELKRRGVFVRPTMDRRSDMHDDGVCDMADGRIMLAGVPAEYGVTLSDDEIAALMLFA